MEDDAELKTIGEEYAAGRMLTGQVKKRLIEVTISAHWRNYPETCISVKAAFKWRKLCVLRWRDSGLAKRASKTMSSIYFLCSQILQVMVKAHQDARAKVTDERVKEFTTPRQMEGCISGQ